MASFENTILAILLMIFLGYLLKRINLLKVSDVEVLNKIVINVAMPCLIFSSLYLADFSIIGNLAMMPLVGLIVGFSCGLIAYIILTFKKFPKKKKWSVLIPIILGNTAFMGFPITLGVFGEMGLLRAIFYDIASLLSFLALSIILIFNFDGELKDAIKRVLSFPVLWAFLLGIILNILNISIGDLPISIIDYMANAAIPLIMISLGLSIQLKGIKHNLKISSFVSFIKLIIGPLISLIIVTIFQFSGMEYTIAIVEAAMPSGMLTLVLTINHDLDFRLTADSMITSTIFSLITLPIIMGLL